MSGFDALFAGQRIMIVLRGCPPDEAVTAATAAWDAGVELVEVPIGDLDQVPALTAVANAGNKRGRIVGAGTVITTDHVRAAAAAGARYTVAPGLDPAILAASLAADLPHLPGVATPTEIQAALRAGCIWVKVFPASALGTGWVKAIRGPFPQVRQVVTGGIPLDEALDYLGAGAAMVAFGAAATTQPDKLTALVSALGEPRDGSQGAYAGENRRR